MEGTIQKTQVSYNILMLPTCTIVFALLYKINSSIPIYNKLTNMTMERGRRFTGITQ